MWEKRKKSVTLDRNLLLAIARYVAIESYRSRLRVISRDRRLKVGIES